VPANAIRAVRADIIALEKLPTKLINLEFFPAVNKIEKKNISNIEK
jgi:hypothetical protein